MGQDNDEARNAYMIDASIMLFKKTSSNVALVEEWLEFCTNRQLISWDPNQSGMLNPEGFLFHIYDQSILSLLAHKYQAPLFRCPSQYGNHLKYPEHRDEREFCLLPYNAPHVNSYYPTITWHHRYKPHGFWWRMKQFLYRETMMLEGSWPGVLPKNIADYLDPKKGFF
jgi:hypothetical protein